MSTKGFNNFSWPLTVAAMVFAAAVGGCATMTEIDPSPLKLETGGTATTPTITHVTIKNGAGEVLFDDKPDDKGLASANPDTSKLDGTLVISSRWSDKVTEGDGGGADPQARARQAGQDFAPHGRAPHV